MRCVALALLMLSLAATADVISQAPDTVRVTLYGGFTATSSYAEEADNWEYMTQNGLVMVSETRTIDLPAGTSKIVFLGVADAIVPQTAGIEGLRAAILESNFDYDLLTPGAVIAKSHGERVRLVRTDSATGRTTEREATLRSGPEGVVLEIDGKFEALGCSGLDEKLVFARVPSGLADEPRLSMTVRADTAGKHTVQLNYLALGIGWSADYIARVGPDGQTLDLSGWLTLINRSGTTFANTPAEVVAGQLARDEEESQPPGPTTVNESASCWPVGQFAKILAQPMLRRVEEGRTRGFVDAVAQAAPALLEEAIVTGTRLAQMRELGDYKLYAVPEPTTLAARQSKQVAFLSQSRVPFTRIYAFTLDEDSITGNNDFAPRPATTLLRLQNKESEGLGKPLPAGTVSIMETADGGAVLAGQDQIRDTPVGLDMELKLGTAMDVWVVPRVTEERSIELSDHDEQLVSVEVKLGNDKPVPITLEYRQPSTGEGFRIVRESRSHTMKEGEVRWTFRLRPGGRTVLRYSMQRSD
jgi:hypothetical protein